MWRHMYNEISLIVTLNDQYSLNRATEFELLQP